MDGVAKRKTSKLRDPLEPLMTANGMVLKILALAFLAGLVAMPFGHGVVLGWGQVHICVGTDGVGSADTTRLQGFIRPHPGTDVGTAALNLCAKTPSAGQRWWYSLENFPTTATVVVVALATYLMLRKAQQNGLYAPGIASRIRFLGWFLVADSVLRPLVQVYASHKLWATMADGPMPTMWSPVWAFLFAGIALLSLARMMAVGTTMREDLEGVV
ncbi:hypothetical protein ABIA35_000712 [Catenulispora sp. MAP12-49]|uniref:hypothetical protein n=1 Tax=unclassified Catenulispora TaxID=414885 RepID=UPI003515A64B